MFAKYNLSLRAAGNAGDQGFQRSRAKMCKDNQYVTTLHTISSAIVKLGKLSKAHKVYRGISGRILPTTFWVPDDCHTWTASTCARKRLTITSY